MLVPASYCPMFAVWAPQIFGEKSRKAASQAATAQEAAAHGARLKEFLAGSPEPPHQAAGGLLRNVPPTTAVSSAATPPSSPADVDMSPPAAKQQQQQPGVVGRVEFDGGVPASPARCGPTQDTAPVTVTAL